MIVAAGVLPQAPVLLRELTGLTDPVEELRAACRTAVRAALSVPHDRVVVLCDDVPWWRPLPGTHDGSPLGRQVARRLLEETGGEASSTVEVPRDADADEVLAAADAVRGKDRVVVLAMGDGSACRGELAPGFLDERAFAYDDALAAAIGSADRGALASLDPAVSRELLVAGRAVFQVLAAATEDVSQARLLFRDDPFGLTYLVATWLV